MVMKCFILIKVRCRIIMELKVRLIVDVKLYNRWGGGVWLIIMFVRFKMKEIVIKMFVIDKFIRMMLEVFCRFGNL